MASDAHDTLTQSGECRFRGGLEGTSMMPHGRSLHWFCCGLALLVSVARGQEESVSLEPQSEGIAANIGGTEFVVLRHGASLPKPYFWPVRAADGTILTRPVLPDEKEHPHHRGIWLAVDEVNDIKYWAERGKIVTREMRSQAGNPARLWLTNDWLGHDGTITLHERTIVSIYPNRLITYDISLAPPIGQLARFDDTKEGLFGIRIAQSMREKEGGIVTNSEGKTTTQECWGKPARWVDYTGTVEGKLYGVTLMDHPDNFRPSRYHVRDYGLFSISPFGEGAYQNDPASAKPVILDNDHPSLRIRYGLYVHSGPADKLELDHVYDQFLRATIGPPKQ